MSEYIAESAEVYPQGQNVQFEVRDRRGKDWFWLDNASLAYIKPVGGTAWAVYTVLCKMADNDTQKCYPSWTYLCEFLGMKRNTLSSAMKKLEGFGLIEIQRVGRGDGGLFRRNVYTLAKPKILTEYPKSNLVTEYPLTDSVKGYSNYTHSKLNSLRGAPPLVAPLVEPSSPRYATSPAGGGFVNGKNSISENYSEAFLKFWKAYPKKVGKGAAWAKWKRLKCERFSQDVVDSVADHLDRDPYWAKGFIPLPTTFLNQRRWEDEIDEGAGPVDAKTCPHEKWDLGSDKKVRCLKCGTEYGK